MQMQVQCVSAHKNAFRPFKQPIHPFLMPARRALRQETIQPPACPNSQHSLRHVHIIVVMDILHPGATPAALQPRRIRLRPPPSKTTPHRIANRLLHRRHASERGPRRRRLDAPQKRIVAVPRAIQTSAADADECATRSATEGSIGPFSPLDRGPR